MISRKQLLLTSLVFLLPVLLQAEDEPELWIQRWGISEATAPIDYDPEAGHLLTNQVDSAVLWDVRTGLALRNYRPADERHVSPRVLRFHRDDGILIGGYHTVSLLNRAGGELIRSFGVDDGLLQCLAVSADESLLAVACENGHIYIWNIETGERLHLFDAERRVQALAFSPDRRLLLSGGRDAVAQLWDLERGTLRQQFLAPKEIQRVKFSSDGRKMMTYGSGEFGYTSRVVVWDVATAAPAFVVPVPVWDVSMEGDRVRCSYPNRTEELWDPAGDEDPAGPGELPKYRSNPKDYWLSSPAGWRLHLQSEPDLKRVTLYSPSLDVEVIEFPASASFLNPTDHYPLAFSPDGRRMLTGRATLGYRPSHSAVWDLATGQQLLKYEYITVGTFHPDGKRVLLGMGNLLRLIDIETGKELKTFQIEEEKDTFPWQFTSVQFTRDGNRFLSSTGDWYDGNGGTIRLWDLETGKVLRRYQQSDKAVLLTMFTPNERQIIVALSPGSDGSSGIDQISVIDAASGEFLRTREFEYPGIWNCVLGRGGQWIASHINHLPKLEGYDEPGSYLFDVDDLSVRSHFRGLPAASNRRGDVLANFEYDGMLSYRDTQTGEVLHAHETPFHRVPGVLIHPGNLLIAGAKYHSWKDDRLASHALGLQHVVTGDIEGEFFLFREPESWLVKTRNGYVNGSATGLAHVTWRKPGTLRVERDPERTRQMVDLQKVGATLTKSLAANESLKGLLKQQPPVKIPEPLPDIPASRPWFEGNSDLLKETIKSLNAAGAELRSDSQGRPTFIKLEKRKVSDDLLARLRWAWGVERLYLAVTGITDAQLDRVGLQGRVKRMSLWENPITDKGLYEISGMWSLEVLDVHDTRVTANGLNALRLLPNLKTLIVPDRIDPADLVPLKESHPELEIIRRGD